MGQTTQQVLWKTTILELIYFVLLKYLYTVVVVDDENVWSIYILIFILEAPIRKVKQSAIIVLLADNVLSANLQSFPFSSVHVMKLITNKKYALFCIY